MALSFTLANALHKSRHAIGGPDALTPADIGAAPLNHGSRHAPLGGDAIPSSTLAAGANLNTLAQPGVYAQANAAQSTVALGYPFDGFTGMIEHTFGGFSTYVTYVQRAVHFRQTETAKRGEWVRTKYMSEAWSAWQQILPISAITPASIGAVSEAAAAPLFKHSAAGNSLWHNPFMREAIGGYAGANYEWVDSGGLAFVGTGSFSDNISCEPGTTITMNVFVMPHPTDSSRVARLAIQNTTMGGTGFDYTGNYRGATRDAWIPPEGANLTVTHTVGTDGFRFRTEVGAGHILWVSITEGPAAPSPYHPAGIEALRGIGSPEGVVTAPIGATYTDTAVTNGAIEWTKWSGSLTTGWRVTKGDTLWRNVAASALTSNWAVTSQRGECAVRREGTTVSWKVRVSPIAADDALSTLLTIPSGFRPALGSSIPFVPLAPPALRINASDHISAFSMSLDDQAALSPNAIVRQGTPAAFTWVWYGSYETTNSWPTTLPGTPA